jgi:hypothetical protein
MDSNKVNQLVCDCREGKISFGVLEEELIIAFDEKDAEIERLSGVQVVDHTDEHGLHCVNCWKRVNLTPKTQKIKNEKSKIKKR